jgi:DNA gyrase inhibitor GyrI
MQTNSYCPRGSFCAFAHGDFEAREFEHQVSSLFDEILPNSNYLLSLLLFQGWRDQFG